MSRKTPLPYLPIPPQEYQPGYFREVMRSIGRFMQDSRVPGPGRHTTMVLTNLPSNDYNLEVGSLFEVDGDLKIAVLHKPHVAGVGGTASVGSVTVSIS